MDGFDKTFTNKYLDTFKDSPYRVPLYLTRKYPLRGYILGVLTHTTALDRLWEGDETLKCDIVIYRFVGHL